jgi:PhnB protein
MQQADIYLNLPGNALEALTFYETVFGSKIAMKMSFAEATFAGPVPDDKRHIIMHAALPITASVSLMVSDHFQGVSPSPFPRVDDLHISVVAADKAEADGAFALLSEGGKVVMPLANAPWGPYFGMCADRFGVQWMVSLPAPA